MLPLAVRRLTPFGAPASSGTRGRSVLPAWRLGMLLLYLLATLAPTVSRAWAAHQAEQSPWAWVCSARVNPGAAGPADASKASGEASGDLQDACGLCLLQAAGLAPPGSAPRTPALQPCAQVLEPASPLAFVFAAAVTPPVRGPPAHT